MKKKKPDVSGEDAALYWYKSHASYNYDKDPGVLHAYAGSKVSFASMSNCLPLLFLKTRFHK